MAGGCHLTPSTAYVRCWMTLPDVLDAEACAIILGGKVNEKLCD
jgi:hypothetical protein